MCPRTVDVAARTTTVLEAAATVFAERGYNAATIEEIAQVAGIGKGTTYEYFKSKQELFLAVIEHDWQRLVQEHDAGLRERDGRTLERLTDLTTAVLRSYREIQRLHPAAMEFMVAAGSTASCERLMRSYRQGLGVFRDRALAIIEAGVARGELASDVHAHDVATVLISALDGLLMQAKHDPAVDPLSLWKPFLGVVVRGLEAPQPADGLLGPPDARTEVSPHS